MAPHRQVHFGPPVIHHNIHIVVSSPDDTNMGGYEDQANARGNDEPEGQAPPVHNNDANRASGRGWTSFFRSNRQNKQPKNSDADGHVEDQAQAGTEDTRMSAPGNTALARLDTQPNDPGSEPVEDTNDRQRTHQTHDWRKAQEQINYNRQFSAMLEPDITYSRSGWAAICKTKSCLMEGEEPKLFPWNTSTEPMFIVLFLQPFTTQKQADTLPKLAEHLLEDCHNVRKFHIALLVSTDSIAANSEVPNVLRYMLNYFHTTGRDLNLQGSITEKEQVFVDYWATETVKNSLYVEVDLEKSLGVGKFEAKTGWINRGATATKEQGLLKQTLPVKAPARKVKTWDNAWIVKGRNPWPE